MKKDLSKYYRLRNMSAFRRAMLEKKHVTVGFIGGSITDPRGRERWSEFLISRIVADYPDVTVDVENTAIGATGSDYAVLRAEQDIICRGCDIVFVEYAVNDNKIETPIRNASREGLIRKLLKGTDADIVITYTYCAEMLEPMLRGEMAQSVAEFEAIAEHYGISSVFMANNALDECLRGTLRWEEWLPDGLHPANTGSRFYADPVYALLEKTLEDENGKAAARDTAPMFADNWEREETVDLSEIERIGYWRLYRNLDRPLVQRVLSTTCVGSRAKLAFEGTGLVLTISYGWMAADYRWRLDGGEWQIEEYDRPWWMDDHTWLKTKTLAAGLESSSHTVEFEVLPPKADDKHKGTAFEIIAVGILKD